MYIHSTRRIKFLLFLPSLIFFSIFVFYPICYSLYNAFQMKPTYGPAHFIGLANFAEMLTDERLWSSVKNTLIIVLIELVLIPPLSFLMGLLINTPFRGNTLVRLLVITPSILSVIVTTLIWYFIVNPRIGLINSVLNAVHIDSSSLQLIGGPTLTPYTVAVIEIWRALGSISILYLAGLKMIPMELYDAAAIDGAAAVQRVRFITLPMLQETNKVVAINVFLGSVQSLQTVWILTKGQPNFKSHTIGSYILVVFSEARAGYGSSLALLMFVVMMGASIIFLRLNAKRLDD